LSLENSVMIFNSAKTPFLIDPNSKATQWLKVHFKDEQSLEVISHTHPKFSTTFELSLRFGKTLVIEEMDKIDPMLIPCLRKDLLRQGVRSVVRVGDKLVDYDQSFRLYLCTRDPAVRIPPTASSLLTLINYSITKSGLEGQLLSLIIEHEKPELEIQKTEALQQEERFKMQLASLEKKLLEELATSTGNILENKTLIANLEENKTKSVVIAKSLEKSAELQQSLDNQRQVYQNLAVKGAQLFLLIQDLKKINNMYRFSLEYFVRLFKQTLKQKGYSANIT
jgi:dynein heavy chain 2, cytosolic